MNDKPQTCNDTNEHRRVDKEQTRYRDHILNFVAGSAHALLTCPDIDEAVYRSLTILGEGTNVDRVYIFENHLDPDTGELLASQRFKWSKTGIASRKNNPMLTNTSYRDFFPRWQNTLPSGHTIKGLIKDFPATEREFLEKQGILSLLVVPIMIEERFWGFIGFDDCHEEREWTESEELILTAAAGNIVNAIERKRFEESLRKVENQYRTIFENTGNATAILEEDTTISLVNAKFEKLSHYTRDEIEGQKRWTAFVVEDDLERLMEYHRLRGIDPNTAPEEYEAKVIDRNGAVHTVYLTIAMLPGTKKRVVSLMDITPLKAVENALRKSEENYQTLFENAGVAIAHVDARGNFLNANDTFLKFIGYSWEDLKNVNAMNVTHPAYNKQNKSLIAKQISGEIDQFTQEKYYIRKDGGLRWGQMRSTPIRDEQGRLLSAVVAIIDRTRRKQAEEALVQSEALYRSLFENAPIGMFQIKFPEGKFLRVNSAFAKMLGYESPEELMSTISDVDALHVDPEDRAAIHATLERQDWFYGEYPRFRKDGGTMIGKVAIRRILSSNGTLNCLEGITEDVTEQKRAEAELIKYAEEIRDLYENAPCGYHSLAKDGTIIRMNDTELAWLGYSRDEVIGRMKFPDLLPPGEEEKFWQTFPILQKQGWLHNVEGNLIRKDGSSFPTILNATAVFDENGDYLMSRSSVFDNTERKQVEDALAENEALLRVKAQELMEANTTMKVLLKTMEKDQTELKERILTNIREQVLPSLEKLKKTQLDDIQKGCIEIAETCLDEIASPFVRMLTSRYLNLTKKEIMIASLIKEGKTSKEIAELVNVSKRDVDFHRGKIREKLGLKNKKGNLQILLRTFS